MSECEVDKNLSNILDAEIVSTEEEVVSGEIVEYEEQENLPATVDRDVEYDYEYSRETHRELIDQGQEALEGILKVAKESQHPRAYEVAATLLKNMSDMTDKLMALQEKRKALSGTKDTGGGNGSINVDKAIVFSGSTSDLLKQIKKQ